MKSSVAAAVAAFVFTGAANATTTTGIVTSYAFNKSVGNVVYVLLSAPLSGRIACATDTNWSYVFPMVTDLDKKVFATIVEAHVTGHPLTIAGTATCADLPSIESGNIIIIN